MAARTSISNIAAISAAIFNYCACAMYVRRENHMEGRGRERLLIAAVYFLLHLLLLSSADGPGYGEFTAELREGELVVGSTCRDSCSGSADTASISCEIVPGTVSTLVQLTTCLQGSPYPSEDSSETSNSATVFSASETLVAQLGHHENCSTTAGCQWRVELTDQFLENLCVDVHIADFTTGVPPLRGLRKRIWRPTYVAAEENYETNVTELPQCLENTELLQWNPVQSVICSSDSRRFSPPHIYSVTASEVFVTANSSILYSPCRGCVWYQLLLPVSSRISSFTHITSVFYALLTTSESGGAEVWLGVAGVSPLLRVYPSPALQWVWSRDPVTLDSFLTSASLALDSQGNRIAVSGVEELQLPISLLLSHALYDSLAMSNNSTPSSLHLSPNEDVPSLEDRPHPLLRLPQTSLLCPLARVLVEAPICDRVTRSVVEIEGAGFLGSVDHESLPWVDCEVMSDALPMDVFLRLGESYVFTVHLVINPLLAAGMDVAELELVPTLSRPDTVEVVTQGTFHTTNSSVVYQVSLQEKNGSSSGTQVPPATILRSVDVHLQVRGVGMECVDPLNPRLELPGRMGTRVHVGCPPGLSLVFDHLTTHAHDNQFCTPTNNISCYYFRNEFLPVMELVDLVTGERSTYTGPYTLRVLAGGTSRSNMQSFDSSIQSQIWTASADDVISHDNNKIEWTCGLGSPCGEVLPGSGWSPEYYLHLQASNRVVGQRETYCDLTVEFTVRLHGLSMGPITTSITLILLLVVLVGPLLSLFLVWVWRERRAEAGGEGGGVAEWYRGVVGGGKQRAARLREQLKELAKRYQQTPPLEPHLHTD